MSGSIGGDRIRREQVVPTVDRYMKEVLQGFPGFRQAVITGSYNAGIKKDHGDIDLVVWISGFSTNKDAKKDFKSYLDSLEDYVTVPFRSGKRKGDKSQLFGTIVTCQVPVEDEADKLVQIDNIIVSSKEELEFQKNFYDMDAAKQALLMGIVRVAHSVLYPIADAYCRREVDWVLSPCGVSLRETYYRDDIEVSREELDRTVEWQKVSDILYKLNKSFDITASYEKLLEQTAKYITDERARKRIVGMMKSMINIGVGEEGTPKGDTKKCAIELAEKTLL